MPGPPPSSPSTPPSASPPASRGRGRGRPPRIGRDAIVTAALDLGLDTFSVQGVADRLGVSPAALYSHVRGRDEIVALATARLRHELVGFHSDAEHWRGWLEDFAALVRRRIAPSGVVLGDLRVPRRDGQYALGERGLDLLIAAGLDPAAAGYAVWLVFRLAAAPVEATGAALRGYVAVTGELLEPSPAHHLRATRAVQTALHAADGDPFPFDLAVVLDGIEARLARPRPKDLT